MAKTNPKHLNVSLAENVNQISYNETISSERMAYLYTYAGILTLGIASFMFRSFAFYYMCLSISRNLHDTMFRGVARAKMSFFNNNPSGRILNRFARDINNIDSVLPNVMYDIINVSDFHFLLLSDTVCLCPFITCSLLYFCSICYNIWLLL